ncbi:MAG: YraN family protein [Lachnospiraceae bacterium]|nr:YraN family protein [Lachnospiraceae bacterium]
MNKKETGTEWERKAAEYLTKHGMRILEANFRSRQGEIDLIGYHQGYLVFVEVKYRSGSGKGTALEAVNYRKQCKICQVADYYRYLHSMGDNVSVRYDVVGIQGGEIQWVQNAFPHIHGYRSR